MKNRIIGLIIICSFLSGLFADDRRTNSSTLSIMTLNAEFLWDGIAPEEGSVNFEWKNSETEAMEHMEVVAQIIIRNNPDILNLVEVENLDALKTLNKSFLFGLGYKPFFVQGRDTYTGQDVALLSRIDPENMDIYYYPEKGESGNIQKSVSKNYYCKFTIGDLKIAVIGLHFLAYPMSQSRKHKRQAQADAIHILTMELNNDGYSVIVLGDFNDFDGDILDNNDNIPITNVLTIVKSMDTSNPDDDLINVMNDVHKTDRYTAFWDANRNDLVDSPREFSAIDHILLSSDLSSKVDLVNIPHDYDPRLVTDHFPVFVRFKLSNEAPTGIRITKLLPNPEGNEREKESVTIKNFGSTVVDLHNWKIVDLVNKSWKLDDIGVLSPNQEKTFERNGQPMAMNNRGDTIKLIDPEGTVVQIVTYLIADEGEIIIPDLN